ncbi:hypothetical protein LTR66_013362 [Elasticomyces elasticus]|nr:hypothetical protein LTR66_013362 [Elasticomyces elasticus]
MAAQVIPSQPAGHTITSDASSHLSNPGLSHKSTPSNGAAAELAHAADDLSYHHLPPFPDDVPVAPLLRISLRGLVRGDAEEQERLWSACKELGFFYLDLRGATAGCGDEEGEGAGEGKKRDSGRFANGDEDGGEGFGSRVKLADSGETGLKRSSAEHATPNAISSESEKSEEQSDGVVDGPGLLQDAEALFRVGEELFDLPIDEKLKYDFKDRGSYFGYKGYGAGVVDANGTADRNEFYNTTGLRTPTQVSKDDIMASHLHYPLQRAFNPIASSSKATCATPTPS